MSTLKRLKRHDYTVAWLCALALSEQVAAIGMLDEMHEDLLQPPGDDNTYTYGSIKGHNVIVACLPLGQPGTISASILVGSLPKSFPNLKIHMFVGIGGGIPYDPPLADSEKVIHLGDVVIGVAEKPGVIGVVQYDFERDHGSGNRELLGSLDKPHRRLLNGLTKYFGLYLLGKSNFNVHLERLKDLKVNFGRPTSPGDRLYKSSYEHVDAGPTSANCDSCLADGLILRKERLPQISVVHQGQILSGNAVIKNTPRRDELSQRFPDARCIEMEAAGVMDQTHCLVIRGIADYADSHKNQHWQPYAAGTAAAFAREFLLIIQPHEVTDIDPVASSQTCTQKDPPNPAAFTPDEKACLQSLHFTEMHSRKNDVTDPAPSTCTWLLKHPKYREWLGQGHGMLWIKGKPGAGKSTLLKHALETAERESKVGITLVSFFFHGRGAPMQKTVLGLFRSLLHQILQKNRDLLSKLTSLYKRSSETEGEFGRKWNWHEKQLQNFFKQNVVDAARTHPIRIYIDALDECGEDVATELVEFLRCLAAPISICFSCRHYPFVALEGGNEVCVEHENEQDIESYINDKINTHVQRVDIAQVIRDEMVSRSNSNFQWVVLVLPRVLRLHKSRKSLAAIQTVIRNIPAELSELYTTLLDFVDEDERVQSLRLLQWISFAFRPLTLSELRCALAVGLEMNYKSLRECQVSGLYVDTDEDMERIVCDRSKGLAEVSNWPGVRIVQFVHQSVKDFLLEQGFQSLDYASAGTVVGRGHFRLSRSCFKYFLMEEVQDFATSTPSTSRSTEATATSQKRIRLENDCPMLSYSVEYLFRHVQEVDVANMSQNDLVALSYKRIDGTLLQSWFAVFAVFKDDFIGGTLLHAASAYNLISVVKVILARNVWADPKDKSGDTPLSRAAANGHNVVVDMLMNRDDVDVNSKNKRCRTPLSMASKCGHEAMVMMLLNRPDVDVNTKDEDGGTPLSLAVERGNEAIVEILLNRDDVDVNSRDKNSDTPLFIASTGMQETMVKILLNRDDVDVNSKNRYGDTPFSGAARSGYVSITKLFLERGVHLSQTHGQLTTALSEAAGKGQSGLMELLLQCNAKIDSTNDKGRTPLSYAAPQGCYEIVKLLLQYNANVNSRDYQGRTPFSYAVSWGGCYEIVKLLLQYNANIDSRDNRGRTPLSYAASQGCFNIVKLLLPYNVNVNARDNLERTPLSYAALYGCCMTVNLLLQRTVLQDVDIDVRDIYGRTPLSYAACRGHIAVVKLLLEGSSNADQKAEDGRTPFSYAAGNGYMKVLELMVERGNVDINSKDSHGRSPLSWALLFQGYWIVDVVEYLLKQNDVIVTEEDRDLMKKRFRYGGVDVGLTEEEVWSEEGSEEESEKEQSEEEQNDEESEEAGSEVDQNSRATKRVRSQSDLEQPRKQTPMSIDTLLN